MNQGWASTKRRYWRDLVATKLTIENKSQLGVGYTGSISLVIHPSQNLSFAPTHKPQQNKIKAGTFE